MNQFIKSLTGRMALGVICAHFIFVPILFYGVFKLVESEFHSTFINKIRNDTHLYSSLIKHEYSRIEKALFLEEILINGEIVYAEYLNSSRKKIIPGSGFDNEQVLFKEDFFFGEHNDDIYFISIPVIDDNFGKLGSLRLGYDEKITNERITSAYYASSLLAISYILISLIIVLSFGRRLSKPITQLRDIARKITSGQRNVELNIDTDILEISELVEDLGNMHTAIIKNEERFRSAFEYASIGKVLVSSDHQILELNQSFCDMLGYKENELIGRFFSEITHKDDIARSTEFHKKLFSGEIEKYNIEKQYIHKDGHAIWAQLGVSLIYDKDNKPVHAIAQIQDISVAKQLSEKLSFQASHDELTGLANRREFNNRIARILDTARKNHTENALCYLDLDQFKVINDTCGHVAGDELLRQLSSILSKQIRKRDTLARLGGDEFGVLMEHCTLQQAQRVANELHQSISNFRFMWEKKSFNICASMGIVPITDRSGSITEILQHADAACYAAKEAGRNRINVYNLEDKNLLSRHGEMQWVSRINKALEKNRFHLVYQPILPIQKTYNENAHFEILLRLIDEKGNSILPNAFLPAAERYNLSVKLDRWVVNSTIDWLASNPDILQNVSLCSINLSGHTFSDKEFLSFVIQKFDTSKIPTNKLCFEITETAAISNLVDAGVFVNTLKGFGCNFALDDFGSGLSSFGYLKNLPVDYLKIDGVFVKDILDDPIDFEMVRSINDIGHVMGKKTIAEFVENREILEKLKEIGVDYAQGYGISEPIPIENYEFIAAAS